MKRRGSNLSLALLFVSMGLLYPVWHRTHCDTHLAPASTEPAGGPLDHPHDAARCPVCQLAATPLIVAAPPSLPGASLAGGEPAPVHEEAASSRLDPALPFARAPPAQA